MRRIIVAAIWLATLAGAAVLRLVSSLVLALVSVVVRSRRSRDVEREQLKWFVAANLLGRLRSTLVATTTDAVKPATASVWLQVATGRAS